MRRFFALQSVVLVVKGVLPLLTFYAFNRLTGGHLFAEILIAISIGNVVGNLSNLSANTIGGSYRPNSENDSDSENYDKIFQFYRILIFSILCIPSFLFLVFKMDAHFYVTIPCLLFQSSLALLPSWKGYASGNVSYVLDTELKYRAFVYISIAVAIIFSNYFFIIVSYIVTSSIFILRQFSFISNLFLIQKFDFNNSKNFLRLYVREVLLLNFFTVILNSGMVFLSSFLFADGLVAQVALMERVKAIGMQFQGIFMMERIPKNRLLLKDRVFGVRNLFRQNIHCFFVSAVCLLICISVFSFLPYFLEEYFGYDERYFLVFLIGFTAFPVTMLSGIFGHQVLANLGALRLLRVGAIIGGMLAMILGALAYLRASAPILLSCALVYELAIAAVAIHGLRKHGV